MKIATLLFLVKRGDDGSVRDVCLAMKKRGFGAGRWNGAGGKVEAGETPEEAARREGREEIGVTAGPLTKGAELTFTFPHNPSWDFFVHAYVCEVWEGEPAESEEMRPQWYAANALPFSEMWPDDPFWLPQVLAGERVQASFTFGEGDVILAQEVSIGATFA